MGVVIAPLSFCFKETNSWARKKAGTFLRLYLFSQSAEGNEAAPLPVSPFLNQWEVGGGSGEATPFPFLSQLAIPPFTHNSSCGALSFLTLAFVRIWALKERVEATIEAEREGAAQFARVRDGKWMLVNSTLSSLKKGNT